MTMAASKWRDPKDLIDAAERGDVERAKSLLDDGFDDVNGRDYFRGLYESTALHAASKGGHADVAEVLIKHGADVNAKNDDESTALHEASKGGHADVAEVLIKHGADVNAKNRQF
ncbi:GA-binding protein subunit beta-1-like [Ptychodera flava]|uniref:GA-binding protein subunit beta-1-like n=1 Tax=Ptychodera flava TaxID=63121 RepID=UPI00396A17E4